MLRRARAVAGSPFATAPATSARTAARRRVARDADVGVLKQKGSGRPARWPVRLSPGSSCSPGLPGLFLSVDRIARMNGAKRPGACCLAGVADVAFVGSTSLWRKSDAFPRNKWHGVERLDREGGQYGRPR